MLDVYAQVCSEMRVIVASNPGTLLTWPEMVRQGKEVEFETRLYATFAENPLTLVVSHLAVRFRGWFQNLWARPVGRMWIHRYYLPLKRHSSAQR